MPELLSDWTDAQLVHRCRAGDELAWQTLVHRYRRLVFTVPRRAGLSDHDAADVFQNCFSTLFEHLGDLDQPDRLNAWLVTTARRETLRVLQRTPRHARLDTLGADAEDGDSGARGVADENAVLPPDRLAALQTQDRLRRAMDGLDKRSRELLTYLYLVDPPLSYEEIAERMGMALGSIGPTRTRCLDKLRRLCEAIE
ncbi:MAG: sigma-70 family RNA polymerase sigma factor [Vitreoscilla sp.]|nr:sigma-70 family RNA polymerase sigma factor [Vitreoscilla sp.]